MTEAPYTKRELDTHFSEVKDILSEIKTQTMKTNGRVGRGRKAAVYVERRLIEGI